MRNEEGLEEGKSEGESSAGVEEGVVGSGKTVTITVSFALLNSSSKNIMVKLYISGVRSFSETVTETPLSQVSLRI